MKIGYTIKELIAAEWFPYKSRTVINDLYKKGKFEKIIFSPRKQYFSKESVGRFLEKTSKEVYENYIKATKRERD